jgi:hypothetical protein
MKVLILTHCIEVICVGVVEGLAFMLHIWDILGTVQGQDTSFMLCLLVWVNADTVS